MGGFLIGQDVTETNLTPAQKDIITTKMIILQGDDGRLAQAFYHSKHGFIVQLINSDEEVLHTYKIGK